MALSFNILSERAATRSKEDGISALGLLMKADSTSSGNSSSYNVPVAYFDPTDCIVSRELSVIVAGSDNDIDNLEGLRAGISGVIAVRSRIGSSGVC